MSGFSIGQHIVNEMLGTLGQRIGVAGQQTQAVYDLLNVCQLGHDCQLLVLRVT